MAVPASNIGLQRLRQDHDLAVAGALDDKAIRWRTHAFTGSEVPISITALANSAGCIQDVDGRSWGWGGDRSMSAKDRVNSQYMSSYKVTTTPSTCVVEAGHRGQASTTPVATISRHYAYIDGGGNMRVRFNVSSSVSGFRAGPYVEILGSSSGYLQGSNTYLATINPGAAENRVINVPADRPFVSVMLQCNISGSTNPEGGIITYSNLRITKE